MLKTGNYHGEKKIKEKLMRTVGKAAGGNVNRLVRMGLTEKVTFIHTEHEEVG